uniref:Gamma-glutamyltransferase 5a n=1 Tax=Haplochromis burtoni TaxID=8153 RepID=A0A3Q2WHW0_HAPBU
MFPGTPASSHSPKTVSGACIIEIQLQNGKILIEILIQLITVNSFREILRKNGSAVDAAIAALLCTSIINPQSAGIGGGSIFTIMDRSGKVTIINSRETVPSNVTPDLSEPYDSRWIGVPGEIRGYEAAHRLYGKLPWADLFQPAIKLARNGSRIEYTHGQYIQQWFSFISLSLSFRELYLDKNGNLLKTGDTVKFEKLADTLETIANEGPDVFYNGTIAKNLISDIQKAGNLTLGDLASYEVKVTEAWNISLGDYMMYFPPPPAGGAILSLILNIMKGYKINKEPNTTDEKTLFYHRYIEALKFANGLRKRIGDPKFDPANVSITWTDLHLLLLDRGKSFLSSYIYKGTTHVSVLAEDGSAVSVTSSINDESVSGWLVLYLSGERPPSSMAPAVLKSQSKMLVIGGAGSTMITTGIASVYLLHSNLSCNHHFIISKIAVYFLSLPKALINHLWFNKSLEDAIKAPVFFVDSEYDVMFEPELTQKVIYSHTLAGDAAGTLANTSCSLRQTTHGASGTQ